MILPFFGLVAVLTLWGTFVPVPFTNMNPEQSFVRRLIGATKTTYMLTSSFELVIAAKSKILGGSWHEGPEVYEGVTDLVVTWNGSLEIVPVHIPAAESTTEFPYDVVVGIMGSDFNGSSVGTSCGHVTSVVGALTFVLCLWLGLVPLTAYTRKMLSNCAHRLFAPHTEMANHLLADLTVTVESGLVVVQATSSPYDTVMALVVASSGLEGKGASSNYNSSEDDASSGQLVLYVDPKSILERCLPKQVKNCRVSGEVTFHPVLDMAIAFLGKLQIGLVACLPDCSTMCLDVTPVEAVCLMDSTPLDSGDPVFDSVYTRQSQALVLRRLENISQFVIFQLAMGFLESLRNVQTIAVQDGPGEEVTMKPKKKNRAGQKARRRLYRRDLREKQTELIMEIECQSTGLVPVTQPAPQAPAPASSVEHRMPSTFVPMAPSRQTAPVRPQGPGYGYSHPSHLPPPPPLQYTPGYAGQPPYSQVNGGGGQMPPPWQYQQYGHSIYPYQGRFN
ncbi:hypothetical protein AJ80_08547 [Polytolypa hystricis UAMH7299]|uniref:Uncharacterized protein n=1 Tax=Polytolypa hystricis (strain UAMH7299) TaxID=1447883 RepID=A0A2B7X640_POLH7|nr:hypothetical protein AJ80_08547 [Polytolypa hystricis UAMH7299]